MPGSQTASEVRDQVVAAVLSALPKQEHDKLLAAKAELRAVVEKHGDYGLLALALLGADTAEKAEREQW